MNSTRWIAVSLILCTIAAGAFGAYLYVNRPQPLPPPVVVAPPASVVPAGPPPFSPTVFEPMSVQSQTARIPVIMYHDVVKERGRSSVYFDCTVDELKEHLDYLAENEITPISLETLHKHLVRGEPVPEKSVVLTFDDNYQGFHDNAYPMLKERGYPAAMFVHTNFVGDKSGSHPKMDWETLKLLDKEGLVTIGPHTLSHPADLTALSEEEQVKEITECKTLLEQQLGHATPYFCYPVGKNDERIREMAQQAGYTMAFTMENGPVQQSPGILQLNRYIQTRFEKAFEDAENARLNTPAAVYEVELSDRPVRLEVAEFAGTKLGMVRGGLPKTWRLKERKGVGRFIEEAGGVAGINGTFFADARIRGTDATMIGPCITSNDGEFVPDLDEYRLTRLVNRPVVLISPKKLMIVPFQPGFMSSEAPFKAALPEMTDMFLAGAWIVHDGVARTEEQLRAFSASDFAETRRRAFFGVTATGEIMVGATLEVVSTMKMAEAAAEAGVQEAVLLDSGFSTSVIYDNKIIVTGHTAEHIPSRPVPHAIILSGTLEPPTEPEVVELLSEARPAVDPEGETMEAEAEEQRPRRRRRRRSRRSTSIETTTSLRVAAAASHAPRVLTLR